MEIVDWLRALGLEQYAVAFAEHGVTADLLPTLTPEDLKDLGIRAVGHRRRLLDAIVTLRDGGVSAGGETPLGLATSPGNDMGSPQQPSGQRRQVSVMFCDMTDFTQLSTVLDPEDLSAVVRAYQASVATTIASFDGFIARYVGDGVLVYFGYPQAREDDAERAVRAALAVIAAIRQAPPLSERVRVRVGIATGLVVIGEMIGTGEARQQTAIGETPNLAARLQGLAEPNTVVIAAGTRRLVGDLFEYRDLGVVSMKGFAGPVPAWQVLGPSAVESRFEALRGPVVTRLVGRDKEVNLFLRTWALAKAGQGQVVLLSGEAGLGKSRLCAELSHQLQTEPHLRLRYFCSPHHQNSALFPFVDQLGRASGFARDDTYDARLEKLETLLVHAKPSKEDVALLTDLMSLPASERYPLPNLNPRRKKERTLEALIGQLEGLAANQPVLLVFEDAHWADPTSLELLNISIECLRSLSVLMVVTFRPEFMPPWRDQSKVTEVALNRLERRDWAALVEQIAGGKAFPQEVIEQIGDRTDGIPLFIEEITKSVLESGLLREVGDRYVLNSTLPPFAIPMTLNDSLMARLDRLSSVRLVAQIGAAIGREFSYELIRAVSRLPDVELQSALARLVAAELIFQRSAAPVSVYVFKHALVQDAAHNSLLRNTRQELHARIAAVLEAQWPEITDTRPEILAQHYAEAGLIGQSVFYWSKAGDRSSANSTMAEAAAQYRKGIDQLALLPDSIEHQRQELKLRAGFGAALMVVKGFAAAETGDAYARARQLWEQLGSSSEFLQVPYGQSIHHLVRGELDVALRLDEDLLRLSHQHGDSAGLVMGHFSSGINLMFSGAFPSSQSHLEQVITHYDPSLHRLLAHQAGTYPHVASQIYLGNVLFFIGLPDQAVALSRAAIEEARRLAHPPSLALCLATGARLLELLGDDALLGEWVDQLVAVTSEQSFPHWRAHGTIGRGWLKVKAGNIAEGLALLSNGSAAFRATGAEVLAPYHLALCAKACASLGRLSDAMAHLDDALHVVERTGERWFLAELNRSMGQLLLQQRQIEAAEKFFRKALGVSTSQRAKLWQLRAATSLAQLLRERGQRRAGYELLAEIYGSFNEGLETPDLEQAKALLEDLP